MPHFGPIGRADLLAALRRAGFTGPYTGGHHQVMVRGTLRLRIPNPHRSTIGINLLARLLDQAGITREEWERL